MNDFLKLIMCFIVSFLICTILSKQYIKWSKKRQYQQYVRQDIVDSHHLKQGTPTMGGCIIFIATSITFFIFVPKFYLDNQMLGIFFVFLFFGIIGLMDDLLKIIYKNSDGLSAKIRLLFEIVGSLVAMYILGKNQTEVVDFPLTHYTIPLGSFLLIYFVFVLVGTANAVNFTDGLDGLAAGLMISAILPFLLIALKRNEYELSYFIMGFIGSLAAFLQYNFNPARLFMGDVGSLSIGAVYAMIAIVLKSELLILVSGCIFLVEILSVILQVGFFKLSRGKRLFKMAPIHHHFEKKGMPEWKVVMSFWMVGFLLSIIASMIGVMG